MEKFIGILLGLFLLILAVCGITAALALFIWLAWNYVAVPAFSAHSLSYFRCVAVTGALMVIASIFRNQK